jgi:hypothetical protein
MMHSGASDKTVNWLRRCVPRVSEALLTCDSRGSSSVGDTLAEEGEFICIQWAVYLYSTLNGGGAGFILNLQVTRGR